MKAHIGYAFFIGWAVAAAGCSFGSSPSSHPSASSTEDGTGAVGMQLTLPGGAAVDTIAYVVKGPNGASTIVASGIVPVGNSTSIFFQTPDTIPVGAGYTVTLTGADDAGDTCIGTSLSFAVTARMSTPVLVQLQCHGTANGNGSTTVTGTTSNCATWQSINPATSNILTGVADPVVFTATGPDHGSLAFSATASGVGAVTISPATGTLSTSSPNGGSFNVTCTSPGLVNVTVVFSDGRLPDGGSCDSDLDTVSFPIQCEGAADQLCDNLTGAATGCTKTELAFVQHDPTGQCLQCLVNNAAAVDDVIFGDTGNECGDPFPSSAAFPNPAVEQALCLRTLDCILSTNVGNDNPAPNDPSPTGPTCANAPADNIGACYCGAGVPIAACAALTTAPSGMCAAVEAEGLGLPIVPALPILQNYTNTSLPSGRANAIFVSAQANFCTTCF